MFDRMFRNEEGRKIALIGVKTLLTTAHIESSFYIDFFEASRKGTYRKNGSKNYFFSVFFDGANIRQFFSEVEYA